MSGGFHLENRFDIDDDYRRQKSSIHNAPLKAVLKIWRSADGATLFIDRMGSRIESYDPIKGELVLVSGLGSRVMWRREHAGPQVITVAPYVQAQVITVAPYSVQPAQPTTVVMPPPAYQPPSK